MSNKQYDYLIVGSGLYGATFAYMAKQHAKKCLVLEKRDHIGGNVYCETIEGITVHKYGPHIFHTSDKEVWDFVNKFMHFNNYINSPLARYGNELYNLPFNMNTFHQIWGIQAITPADVSHIISKEKKCFDKITNLEEQALSLVGKTIYEKLIKGYTEKQWGRACNELPPSIIKRLPLRMIYNNNYFNDIYQGIPIGGYNSLIESLLDGTEVKLRHDFLKNRTQYEKIADKIVFTGTIDSFFNYCYGHLEYRALRFESEILNMPNAQGNAVVNYTDKQVPYTRITEHKHFECLSNDMIEAVKKTVLTKEYSEEYNGSNEPAYPIPTPRNNELYMKYKRLSQKYPNIIFGGRLGTYKYMDMAPVIKEVLNFWKHED